MGEVVRVTYVLGIDPGGTTGIVLLEMPYDAPAQVKFLGEVPEGLDGFLNWWDDSLRGYEHDQVVCESFELDGRTPKPDLTPKEIIGALKVLCRPPRHKETTRRLVFQTNTQGKHLMTNEVLKRAGYYPKRGEVKGGHSTDALRHALTYVVKTLKHKPTIELLFPKEES